MEKHKLVSCCPGLCLSVSTPCTVYLLVLQHLIQETVRVKNLWLRNLQKQLHTAHVNKDIWKWVMFQTALLPSSTAWISCRYTEKSVHNTRKWAGTKMGHTRSQSFMSSCRWVSGGGKQPCKYNSCLPATAAAALTVCVWPHPLSLPVCVCVCETGCNPSVCER